jgi:heat shock protein HslJ
MPKVRHELTTLAAARLYKGALSGGAGCSPRSSKPPGLFLGRPAAITTPAPSVAGEKLTLRSAGGGAILTYKAQSQQLAGTSWTVLAYNNGKQAVVSVLATPKLTAVFGRDGNLTGFAGCNNYNATYKATAPKISIGPVASTKKECGDPAGVMDQEGQYLAALQTAATYRVDGTRMEMRTPAGALAAEFQRR